MAVKGESVDIVNTLLGYEHSLINMIDNQSNMALHIPTRKNRIQIVNKLLDWEGLNKQAIKKSGETLTPQKIMVVRILQPFYRIMESKVLNSSNHHKEAHPENLIIL